MLLAGAVTAALAATPALADTMLKPVQDGGITYISGGIGLDEEDAIKAQAQNYNLQVTTSNTKGEWLADTNLSIAASDGREVLNVSNVGPLFYAALPPGTYRIEASSNGEQQTKTIKVGGEGKATNLHLIWHATSAS
jgi:hypothetical protein